MKNGLREKDRDCRDSCKMEKIETQRWIKCIKQRQKGGHRTKTNERLEQRTLLLNLKTQR